MTLVVSSGYVGEEDRCTDETAQEDPDEEKRPKYSTPWTSTS